MDYGCKGRQRTVWKLACVKNLEANEEESEAVNKEMKSRIKVSHRWVERPEIQCGAQGTNHRTAERVQNNGRKENEKGRWENIDYC